LQPLVPSEHPSRDWFYDPLLVRHLQQTHCRVFEPGALTLICDVSFSQREQYFHVVGTEGKATPIRAYCN